MRIVHVISGLHVGGAETLLYRLIRESRGTGAVHVVVSLSSLGPMGERIRALGVDVRALGMSNGVPQPWLVARLVRWLVELRPDVVQTWMYHADLVGGLAACIARRVLAHRRRGAARFPLVWAIHQTEFPALTATLRRGMVAKACAWASSRLPDLIVCCAETARASHVRGGYCAERMQVIRNGFDVDLFRPMTSARDALRRTLGVAHDTLLVGIVGRYDAAKDYRNFVAAISRVKRQSPGCHYVMAGLGLDADNAELRALIERAGMAARCHLLGPRDDLHLLIPGFDVFCLSSRSEGFPTVVGEAMACGVPCVVTDVGDTALLVGGAGCVVPPENPVALANGLLAMLRLPAVQRHDLGQAARQRVHAMFSIESTWRHYQQAYAAAREGAWRCAGSRVS